MIIRVSEDLAVDSSIIISVSFKQSDGSITIELSNGSKWELYGMSKRFFNTLIKNIQANP